MPQIHIREFQDGDYERTVEIINALEPAHPITIEEVRYRDTTFDFDTKYRRKRYAAVLSGKLIAGVAQYSHTPWEAFHPKKFFMAIWVDPFWHRRGIGTSLYNRMMRDLESLGAITVRAGAREDRPDAIQFLERRGFNEKMRTWESTLDIASFDFARFSHYLDAIQTQGILITSLDEESRTDPDCHRKLHDLYIETARDEPLPDQYTPLSLEEFMKDIIGHPDTLPKGFFIAKHGDTHFGICNLWKMQRDPNKLYQFYTGVRRDFRGRGIAISLKLKAIQFAKAYGAKTILTHNDSTNKPILVINEKLGFVRHFARVTYEKNLDVR